MRPGGALLAMVLASSCALSHQGSVDAGPDAAELLDGPAAPDVPERAAPIPIEPSDTEPLCLPLTEPVRSVDLYVDSRGLFLVADAASESVVVHHGGSRWETWHAERHPHDAGGASCIGGSDGGSIWVWPGGCTLVRLRGPGRAECVDVANELGVMLRAQRAWIVDDEHMWIGGVAGPHASVVHIRDDRVAGYYGLDDAPLLGLWGDGLGAFTMSSTAIFGIRGGRWGRRSDAPPGPYTVMWGLDRNELGLGTLDGRVHVFDGVTWATSNTGLNSLADASRSRSMLALASSQSIAAGPGSDHTRVIATWSDESWEVAAVAAGREETFAVLIDRASATATCGSVVVVRFDHHGHAFRL